MQVDLEPGMEAAKMPPLEVDAKAEGDSNYQSDAKEDYLTV
jgi:hypothetical protein